MTATLIDLLSRLSEAGGGARLWGAAARPHYGPAFDRLLAAGVLEERAPAEEWPVCDDCECGIDARPVLAIGERRIAPCPLDAGRDEFLDSEDLRSFTIDEGCFALECLGGDPGAICEPFPHVWGRAQGPGRRIFLTFRRGVVEHLGLMPALRAAAEGDTVVLLAPEPPADVRLRLRDVPDLILVRIADAIDLVEGRLALQPQIREPASPADPPIRLELLLDSKGVLVDGAVQTIGRQSFNALLVLTEHAKGPGGPVDKRRIEDTTQREARDIIRELRTALARGRANAKEVRGWIACQGRSGRYELKLDPSRIRLTRQSGKDGPTLVPR